MTATTTQDLEFVRDYKVGVDRLWRAVTQPDQIVQWFGPEGVDIDTCKMDRFKVSGQVTHVRAPAKSEGSVGFTWAWHDDDDKRGAESHVIFEVSANGDGARFRLIHRDLDSTEAAQNHSRGWLSTLAKLEAFMTT